MSVSPSGRFSILSANAMVNMDLLRWAENTASSIEASTGLDVSTGPDRKFRIVVRDAGTNSAPAVGLSFDVADKKLVMTMVIRGYNEVSISKCRLIFCRMILANWIAERKEGASSREIAAFLNGNSPPGWFATGLCVDIDQSRHGRLHDSAMSKWERGKVPGATSLLKASAWEIDKDDRKNKHDVAWFFFLWLNSLGKEELVFDSILSRIASGRELTLQWLAGILKRDSVDDLELDWDRFFLERRRSIIAFGKPSLGALRQLEGKLLLYRGNSGIPRDSEIKDKSGFAALIEKKNKPWLDEFAGSRAMSLKLTAMGRGEEFREVVESYCRFLEKLRKGEDDRKLILLLREANRRLEKLRSRLLKNESGQEDGRN